MRKNIFLLLFVISCSTTEMYINSIKSFNYIYSGEKNKLITTVKQLEKFNVDWIKKDSTYHERVLYRGTNFEIIKDKNKKNTKALYIIRGGSFMHGLSNISRKFAEKLLTYSNEYDIFLLDYKQYPEYYYPKASEDFFNAYEFIKKRYTNIYLMGDSAGGNIIVSSLFKLRDEGEKMPNAIVLLSPFLDISYSLDSRIRNIKTDIVIGSVKDNYVPDKMLSDNEYFKYVSDKKDPNISPVFGEFHNFPATYIEVDKGEILYDDSFIIYEKLKKNNIEVVFNEVEDLHHVYQIMTSLKESKKSLKQIFEFLNDK